MRKCTIIILLLTLCYPLADACRIVPVPPVRPIVIVPPRRPTIPPRPRLQPITVSKHHFAVTIKDGVATTVLETVFHNPNPRILEGTYLFPLPKGASVSQFSMWIDGKEMRGELLDSKKARDLYISIVRRMIDPGLLEFVGRETFKMRIFPIPARGDKRIKLSYQQILPVDGNLMRYVYPLTTVGNGREDTLGELSFQVNISSKIPIKSVFSPSHKVKIAKENHQASITFSQRQVHPDKDFTLYLSRSDKKIDLSFIPFRKKTSKGYFLLMLTPKVKVTRQEQNFKDVVFVFDTSGSMVGEKIQQARAALKYCLNSLHPRDRFNIIPFSTEARPYKDQLLPAGKDNIKLALEFIEEEIYARGGTNIEEALTYALEMAPKNGNRPYMVVFLTDGKPTIGASDPEAIIKTVKKNSLANLRLFTFGVGDQLNTKLLDRLAEENNGTREYVAAKEDIEIKISSFFDKISSPVLSEIKVKFPSADGIRITEVYPRAFPDLFKGAQLTMLGRYSGNGDQALKVSGILAGKPAEFVYEVSFPEAAQDNNQIPRLWAIRKIGYMLDQIRLNGESSELKKEVVRLAKKFGIVTPYTSYLVLEDDARITRPTTVVRPRPQVWRRQSFSPQARRSMERAKSGIQEDSGENSVGASRAAKKMKHAQVADEAYAPAPSAPAGSSTPSEKKDSGIVPQKKLIKKIDEKTFYWVDNVWYDSEYQNQQKIRIRYLSESYFELLEQKPAIGKFLAIGSRLIVVYENKAYEVF